MLTLNATLKETVRRLKAVFLWTKEPGGRAQSRRSFVRKSFFVLTLGLWTLAASSAEYADVPLPREVVLYLKSRGPVIERHSFQEGRQLLVSNCVDDNLPGGAAAGGMSPRNVSCEAILFNKKGRWVQANRVFLGQGKVIDFLGTTVTVETRWYADADAECCPSLKEHATFSTASGSLVQVRSE